MEYPIPTELLQSIIVQQPEDWTHGPMRGKEDELVRWIKVAELAPTNLIIGLSDQGFWVRGGGASVEVANGPKAITLLPCLEVSPEELRQALRSGLSHLGLPREVEYSFPFNYIIVSGLASGSEYWVKLALDRAEELLTEADFNNLQVRENLQLSSKSAPTQKLRHRARALLLKIGSH